MKFFREHCNSYEFNKPPLPGVIFKSAGTKRQQKIDSHVFKTSFSRKNNCIRKFEERIYS